MAVGWKKCVPHNWAGNAGNCPLCFKSQEEWLTILAELMYLALNAMAHNYENQFKTKKDFQAYAIKMRDIAKAEREKRDELVAAQQRLHKKPATLNKSNPQHRHQKN